MAKRDYDDLMVMIGDMADISKQNTESTKAILQKLDSHDSILEKLSATVTSTSTKVDSMQDEINDLKFNEEVTTDQCSEITRSARRRIFQILGEDKVVRKVYFRTFIGHLYSDMRRNYGLGSRIERTRKRDYQRVLDGIEAWNPVGGVEKLKAEVDANNEAKRKAREMGYDV